MVGIGVLGGIASAGGAAGFTAFGGIITQYVDSGTTYRVHTFRGSGKFVVSAGTADVDYLIVASRNGGDISKGAGGAGAGGVLTGTGHAVSAGTYTIQVGWPSVRDSVALGLTASGGGGGGGYAGGSGGGATAAGSIGSGTAGQGNDGGLGQQSTINYAGGGGGGKGAVGVPAPGPNTAGAGGAGATGYGIGATTPLYAGGGGGCGWRDTYTNGTGAAGGTGGGGTGDSGGNATLITAGSDGVPNTGGGGGGAGVGFSQHLGGAGIVVIRYEVAA